MIFFLLLSVWRRLFPYYVHTLHACRFVFKPFEDENLTHLHCMMSRYSWNGNCVGGIRNWQVETNWVQIFITGFSMCSQVATRTILQNSKRQNTLSGPCVCGRPTTLPPHILSCFLNAPYETEQWHSKYKKDEQMTWFKPLSQVSIAHADYSC